MKKKGVIIQPLLPSKSKPLKEKRRDIIHALNFIFTAANIHSDPPRLPVQQSCVAAVPLRTHVVSQLVL